MSTPTEAFSWKKPDVSHFRIFESSIYCHVSKKARKKLELTIELGIFFKYIDTLNNYRVYLPLLKMTVVRRDVKFDEVETMRCSLERELQLQPYQEIWAPKEEP